MRVVKLVIKGSVPSKKNNYRCSCFKGKPRLHHTQRYIDWERDAILQLENQYHGEPISDLVWAKFSFFMPTRHKRDLSNLYEAPQDALERAKVLENDNLIKSHDGSRIAYDKENPRVEIELHAFEG